jgi:type IV secretion system protein VirB10
LLAGALGAGAIIAFALVNGLSEAPRGRGVAETNVAAAGGPPESIQQAQSQYGAADLPRGQLDQADALPPSDGDLQPPDDPAWANAVERAPPDGAAGGASAPAGVAAPDPQVAAQTSAILFDGDRGERAADDDAAVRLNSHLSPPRSRFEIQSGHVIPAALVTALNSDLPGRVIAQVTAPVYDSVTGNYLLIPQGARLIGTYESGPAHGANRLLLAWNRLILPNGWSINLRDMNATDAEGTSGLRDRTDNHLDRLGAAIGLSAIISVIANESEDEDDEGSSLSQSVGDAAAQQAAQTGARIVDRELTVRPTLRVRAGAPVRVLVMRDIQLRPYAGQAH